MMPLNDADRRPLHLPLVTGLIIVVNAVLCSARFSHDPSRPASGAWNRGSSRKVQT
jgi:hypothetical protein